MSSLLRCRPTRAYVDPAALRANLRAVRERVGPGPKIMAVVKANAYGHGMLRAAREFIAAGAEALAVAFVEEGIALREAGLELPILVLGGVAEAQLPLFLEHDIELCAASADKLEQIEAAAAAAGKIARVHLKIDTGMGRIGAQWDAAEPLLEAAARAKHTELAGVFSHFATADAAVDDAEGRAYTRLQFERFLECTAFFERRSLPTPPRHIANSGGILQHPDTALDMVRPGIMLYGVYPSPGVERSAPLSPALSLCSQVVFSKLQRAGRSLSYGRSWTAPVDSRVVTVPIGYGDGYARNLSGKAEVLVGGRRCPIVGRVTMDAVMVKLEAAAEDGALVTLIGRQGEAEISADELAEKLGTIPYEVFTQLNPRVPRVYAPPPT